MKNKGEGEKEKLQNPQGAWDITSSAGVRAGVVWQCREHHCYLTIVWVSGIFKHSEMRQEHLYGFLGFLSCKNLSKENNLHSFSSTQQGNKIQISHVPGVEKDLSICFNPFHLYLLKNSINF